MRASSLVPPDALQRAAAVLRVLAHAHRLRLVELMLIDRQSVGQLAQAMKLRPNVVSQHLNHMKAHGIVEAQRNGRTIFYRVIDPSAKNLIACIRRHCD